MTIIAYIRSGDGNTFIWFACPSLKVDNEEKKYNARLSYSKTWREIIIPKFYMIWGVHAFNYRKKNHSFVLFFVIGIEYL
jgi:hypothetical protein